MSDCIVYRIVLIGTDQCYIGHTSNTRVRFSRHRTLLNNQKHHAAKLQTAWDQYGETSFAFEIIEECKDEFKLEREQWNIDNLNSCFNGSRIVRKPRLGCKQPAHEVERLRQYMMGNQLTKGRKVPEEEKLRRAAFHKGRKRPEETGQRISAALKGNQNALGRIVSEETRKKISEATKGPRPHVKKVHSPEALEKIRLGNLGHQGMLGHVHKPESKLKASIGNSIHMLYKHHLRPDTEHLRPIVKEKLATASLADLETIKQTIKDHWIEGTDVLKRILRDDPCLV